MQRRPGDDAGGEPGLVRPRVRAGTASAKPTPSRELEPRADADRPPTVVIRASTGPVAVAIRGRSSRTHVRRRSASTKSASHCAETADREALADLECASCARLARRASSRRSASIASASASRPRRDQDAVDAVPDDVARAVLAVVGDDRPPEAMASIRTIGRPSLREERTKMVADRRDPPRGPSCCPGGRHESIRPSSARSCSRFERSSPSPQITRRAVGHLGAIRAKASMSRSNPFSGARRPMPDDDRDRTARRGHRASALRPCATNAAGNGFGMTRPRRRSDRERWANALGVSITTNAARG